MQHRILHVNTTAEYNSSGRIACQIARLADGDGFGSTVAYSRGCAPEDINSIRIGSALDIRLHGIDTRLFDRHGLASAAATRRFIRIADSLAPTIVHLHNIHGYYLNYPILFRWLAERDIPIVWTFHDCWPMTGHCAVLNAPECRRWRTQCHHCPKKAEYPASLLFDRSSANHADKRRAFTRPRRMTIVAVSRWLAEYAQKSFFGKYPVETIHNGIDTHTFRPRPEQAAAIRREIGITPDGAFAVAVASKWGIDKGIADLADLRRHLNPEIGLIAVGIDRRQAGRLPDGIIAVPRVASAERLAAIYTAATVLVNPSHGEALPTVNIEAQACGTPVATYGCGGSPETVTPLTGMAVEQQRPEKLAGAVHHIIDARRRGMYSADECRNHILAEFDAPKQFSAYVSLYRRILGNGES